MSTKLPLSRTQAELAATASWVSRLAPASIQAYTFWPRFEPWAVKLGELFFSQGLLQLLMAVSGFLLLRWMSVAEYAMFTLAFAIQSAMIALVDVGFSSAIVPLVGERVNAPDVIGAYVVAARRLRTMLLPFVLIGSALTFAALGHRQGIPLLRVGILFLLVAVTIWFNAINAVYSAPIVIRQDLRFFHRVQNGTAVIRLASYGLAQLARALTSVFAIAINTTLSAAVALAARNRGAPLIVELRRDDPAVQAARREILRFVSPQIPIMVFNALEGQIMIFIISLVGSGVALANIGALTRLNLLFSFMPALLGWVIQPYFSRIERRLVRRRFWQISAAGSTVLAAVPLVGFLFPEPFLWLLGPKYSHLRIEVGMLFLAGAIGVSVGLVAALSIARKWVFWDAIIWIALGTVGLQAFAVVVYDVSVPAGAIAVMIWGNIGSLIAYTSLAVRGMVSDR